MNGERDVPTSVLSSGRKPLENIGRGILKHLLLLLFFCAVILSPGAQEAADPGGFPVVNEEELPVFPEAGAQAPAEEAVPATVGFGDLLRVAVVLIAIIGVIYLLLYFLRKISPMAENGEERIRILSTRHMRRDNSLHLVEVGNQVFLIGMGGSSVNLISEISDKETLDSIRLETEAESTVPDRRFRNLIQRGLSSASPGGRRERSLRDASPQFLRGQRDRLRRLEDEE